eukprot:5704452-Prymnesium_polylepis.3
MTEFLTIIVFVLACILVLRVVLQKRAELQRKLRIAWEHNDGEELTPLTRPTVIGEPVLRATAVVHPPMDQQLPGRLPRAVVEIQTLVSGAKTTTDSDGRVVLYAVSDHQLFGTGHATVPTGVRLLLSGGTGVIESLHESGLEVTGNTKVTSGQAIDVCLRRVRGSQRTCVFRGCPVAAIRVESERVFSVRLARR